jgi:hypothetical protein
VTRESEAQAIVRLHRDYPGWEVWKRADGVLCAWHVGTVPPVVVRSLTVTGLREQLAARAGGDDAGQH